jgi:hypothetical protein
LWAGVIPVVANASRYIHKYSDNGRGLPMYFIGGERDGGWLSENGMELDRYLKGSKYDVTIVQYLGRGHEHFQDEIQRLFDWMDLSSHRRQFFPREIEALSMRPWDNYFWWLELDQIPAQSIALPAEGEEKERRVRPIKTTARILASCGCRPRWSTSISRSPSRSAQRTSAKMARPMSERCSKTSALAAIGSIRSGPRSSGRSSDSRLCLTRANGEHFRA